MTKSNLVLISYIITFCFALGCTKLINKSNDIPMSKSEKGLDKKLPINPTEKELQEIGLVLVSTLEKWDAKDSLDLIKILKGSGFKPFTERHYVADWYLKENKNTLSCGRIGNANFRIQYEIQLRNVNGKWESVGNVSKIIFHIKQ